MHENGAAFLILEGTCRFFSQAETLDHVVTGTLTDADLLRLRTDFQLESWTLPTRHQTVPDDEYRPYYFYTLGRFEGPRPCVPWRAGCVAPSTRPPVADMSALLTAFRATLERLRESGTPVSGDVRYVLANHHGTAAAWPKPAGWPLGDPAAAAVELGEYTPGTTRLATGDDAAALREIWRQFIDFEITGRSPGDMLRFHFGIPIEVDRRYMLMIRDRLPIENELGLIEY